MMPGLAPGDALVVLTEQRRIACRNRTVIVRTDATQWSVNARPLSAAVMLRFFEQIDAKRRTRRATYLSALRTAFPRSWRRFISADPAARLLRTHASELDDAIDGLCNAPGCEPAGDPNARYGPLGRWHAARRTHPHVDTITLHDAVNLVRDAYGLSWYFDPATWRTFDGTPPAGVVYLEAFALRARTRGPTSTTPTPKHVMPPLVAISAHGRAHPHSLN